MTAHLESSPPRFSLVVPTYNEALNLRPFLDAAHAALGMISHEIIIVDDDSPDLTWKQAEEYALKYPNTRIIRRRSEKGLASAVLCGFDAARGTIIGVMDADRQHDETILPQLVRAIEEGADLAVGSRHSHGGKIQNWPWYRRLASRLATFMVRIALGLRMTDPMSGYFALNKSLYEKCRPQLQPRGYKILLEIIGRASPKNVREIPYAFRNRQEGESKLGGEVILDYAITLLVLTLDRMLARNQH